MSGRFEPKTPVNLNPPKDEPISVEYLSKCDGTPVCVVAVLRVDASARKKIPFSNTY